MSYKLTYNFSDDVGCYSLIALILPVGIFDTPSPADCHRSHDWRRRILH